MVSNDNTERRVAWIKVSHQFLSEVVRGCRVGYMTDLPADAEVVLVHQDPQQQFSGYFNALVRSSQFEPVPEGHVIRTIEVTVRRSHDG